MRRLRQDSGAGAFAHAVRGQTPPTRQADRRAEREAEGGDAGEAEGRGKQDSGQVRDEFGQFQDGAGPGHRRIQHQIREIDCLSQTRKAL